MKVSAMTPGALFGIDIRYVVPIFQRPYVWTEANQWEPLWTDVRVLAERLLAASASPRALRDEPPHFLGAIVLELIPTTGGNLAEHSIVDGQQRLMTLQLLVDAAEAVIRVTGDPHDADALLRLVRNNTPSDDHESGRQFKVWPGLRDQESFKVAMIRGRPETVGGRDRVQTAREFFLGHVRQWAEAGPEDAATRLHTLTLALRDYLKIVVIDLEPRDNAQVVFEALNHRGAPLLAADLIKNFLFQLAEHEGLEIVSLYERYWKLLDARYWRTHVVPSDDSEPRIDEFLRHWLVARLQREVPADQLYLTFREYVAAIGPQNIEAILGDLEGESVVFAEFATLPLGSPPEVFRYRVLDTLGLNAMTPLLLRLMRWHRDGLPVAARDHALRALESWAVRRALCQIKNTETLQVVLEVLRAWETADPSALGEATEKALRASTVPARVWPSDATLIKSLTDTPIHDLIPGRRLRIVLEAIEEAVRTDKSEDGRCPRTLTIEHVMPIAWRTHWRSPGGGQVGTRRRDRLVESLGNLTLVTKNLNPSMANKPWLDEEARAKGLALPGKRTALQRASVMLINAELIAQHATAWNDSDISARTGRLIDVVQRIWPAAAQSSGPGVAVQPGPVDPELAPADRETPPKQMPLKYAALTTFLSQQTVPEFVLTFAEVEDILGFPLSGSALEFEKYWRNTKMALIKAILIGGYRIGVVDLPAKQLTLLRQPVVRSSESVSRKLIPRRPSGGAGVT